MAYSKAKHAFDENCRDVHRLLEIHVDIAGSGPGRKCGVEVLNKSAIVLICAYWEAYNEDVCEEAVAQLVQNVRQPAKIPVELKKVLAKKIADDKNELAPWDLAGNGWQSVMTANMSALKKNRTSGLNTPKAAQIEDLFSKGLGIPKITKCWCWHRMPEHTARKRLDDFVTLRGAIAHRGRSLVSVKKKQCTDFLRLVKELVVSTDNHVRQHLKSATGRGFSTRT